MPLVTIPAPVKGWNTTDSLAQIPSDMAITLDNLIPNTASVSTRKGIEEHATSVGSGNVDSLFELKALSVSKLVSAASGNIYDATSAGSATSLASGFTSNQWQGAVYNGSLAMVNGADAPQGYDGSSVTSMTISGSGLTPSTLSSVITYKNRMYYTQINSQDFWYGALSTFGGALTKFPLGKVGNFGGNLIAIQGLTKDGGSGQDDALCFFMSSGEIIVYEGIDPGSDFVLTGVFKAGRPLNSRGVQKFGADILFATNEGYLPVSSLLPLSFGKDNDKINKYIKGAASEAASAYGDMFGWQIITSPADNILLVNVPQPNNTFVQHVLNVNTLAWCRFTGINSRCLGVFGNTLYMGGTNGTVYKYSSNFIDIDSPIATEYQSPYLRLTKGQSKTTAFRPRVRFDGDMTMTINKSVDFKPFGTAYSINYQGIGAEWGDPWGSPWATTNSIISYLNYNNIGYSTSLKLNFSCGGSIDFYETDFLVSGSNRI